MDAARLKKIDVFGMLPQEDLERLARRAQEASAKGGDVVLKAGAFSDQLLAIEEGTVEVRRDDETIATLGPGDVIGETGILRRALRNASAVATSPLRAVVIAQSDIKQVRKAQPEFDERLQAVMRERTN